MSFKIFVAVMALIALVTGCEKSQKHPALVVPAVVAVPAHQADLEATEANSSLDELDPFAADIEEQLAQLDAAYFQETGLSPFAFDLFQPMGQACFRDRCPVWIQVSKSRQKLYYFLNGRHEATWDVSTGAVGYGTPNFDRNPNGRIYDKYTSTKFPGGDYKGLGNMPYAVFISGGFALHGTAKSNWSKLGKRASHGCIRLHPDNAFLMNREIRKVGIYKTWITVQD